MDRVNRVFSNARSRELTRTMKILRDYFNYFMVTRETDERTPEQMVTEPIPSK